MGEALILVRGIVTCCGRELKGYVNGLGKGTDSNPPLATRTLEEGYINGLGKGTDSNLVGISAWHGAVRSTRPGFSAPCQALYGGWGTYLPTSLALARGRVHTGWVN